MVTLDAALARVAHVRAQRLPTFPTQVVGEIGGYEEDTLGEPEPRTAHRRSERCSPIARPDRESERVTSVRDRPQRNLISAGSAGKARTRTRSRGVWAGSV